MKNKSRFISVSLFILPVVLLFLSLSLGPYQIGLGKLLKILLSIILPSSFPDILPAQRDVVLLIRLPRVLLAFLVGGSLSVSGASFQALFKNPLVNEYILGVSSGAAFGAALSLVVIGKNFPPQIVAFAFALAAVGGVLLIVGSLEAKVVSMILTGIVISAFFSALLALVEFFASPYALQSLFYWLMGSLSQAVWKDIWLTLPLMAAGVAVLILLRWRMNVLSLSDEEGRALGVNIRKEKVVVILAATFTAAAATSVAGIIGWVGLIVPHLVRMMIGADNRRVIPLSAALGASFLLVADNATRLTFSYEIPVGILTSIIGIPLFIFLLKRSDSIWL